MLGLIVLALLTSRPGKADDTTTQKDHVQTLVDSANSASDNLGGDLVNANSLGGLAFLTFGLKGDVLQGALDSKKASNPFEAEDFISRLAGNTQSEESVAWCGNNALVGFNDSGSFIRTLLPPSPSPSLSFSFNGWSRSTNAGDSFTDKGILLSDPIPVGSRFLDLFGDPVLRCTDSSTFYYASLATNTTISSGTFSAISVSKSTDGGASFGGAKIAVQMPTASHSLDKPWMAVSRVGGADYIHVTYTDFFRGAPCPGAGTSIEYVRSIDGGATWSAPIVLDTVCGSTPFVQGSQVAVGAVVNATTGVVYAAWESFPNGFGPGRVIKLKKSTNNGATFSTTAVTVSSVTAVGDGRQVQGLFRTFIDLQGLAVDRSTGKTAGNVYITWHDGRNANQDDPFASPGCTTGLPRKYCFGDVLLSRSVDSGATWSPTPIRVNDASPTLKVDHLFPGIAVDDDGLMAVVFYDRRRDSRNFLIDTFVATSDDGGLKWQNQRVTSNNFAAIHGEDLVVNPAYMGDYLGIAIDALKTHDGMIVAWGDNTRGDPNVLATKVKKEN